MTPWRLLITDPASGSWNMAVDEAIATLSAQGDCPPTLRFYQWQPGTVSLGRHQALGEVNLALLERYGYGIVRRATGGRAILHIDELTYSIAGPEDEPRLAGSILDAYNRLSEGLLLGLQRLGVEAEKASEINRASTDAGPVCFEVPSAYEICADDKKLVGSAQSRRAGYVLQHGSLPLYGDITRLVDVLVVQSEAERQTLRTLLVGRATTVEEQIGRRVSFWEAATVLVDGLNSALDIDLEEGELTSKELALITRLESDKYGNVEWLGRVQS